MIPHANENNNEPEKEIDPEYLYKKEEHVKWYHRILLSKSLKVTLAFILTAIVAPLVICHYLFVNYGNTASDAYSLGSCVLERSIRLPCGAGNITPSECHTQCCYDFNNQVCFHRKPSRFSYISNTEWDENIVLQPRISTVPYYSPGSREYKNSLPNIRISIDEISSSHLSITFYNPNETSLNGRRIDHKNYTYSTISWQETHVVVNGPQGIIFDTVRGPLIASEDIWEVAFKLTDETMYGLGEIPLKTDTVKTIYNHEESFSSVPLIFAKSNGSYHGVLIDVVTPTEITVQDDNRVIIRSITKYGLKFHVFIGPEPKNIMNDVKALIGSKLKIEYWMLGPHICSEPLNPANALNELQNFLNNAQNENIPFESHCGSMPIVFKNGCDVLESQAVVNSGANLLRSSGKRFVPHVSPYIRHMTKASTETENCTNILPTFERHMLLSEFGLQAYLGIVDGQEVFYPIYQNSSLELMTRLWIYDTGKPDGVILVNNWPLDNSNKSHNAVYSRLPYFNKNFERAFQNTPQWNAVYPNNERYFYTHNEYGNRFVNAFKELYDVPIWTTSQWLNGEVVVNRQSVRTSWTNLRKELVEAALGGASGQWLWSTPVCGDTNYFDIKTQDDLCVKWYMASTYFPLIKIHSTQIARHPQAFVGTSKSYIINALKKRLTLLPYFFTTLQEGPLLRPMFYQYPFADKLINLISQFNVGDDLLIVPNIQPRQSHVHVHMPPGTWYEFLSGLKINGDEGEVVTMTTTEADFLTFIRGGSILMLQKDVSLSADESRLNSAYTAMISLECISNNEDQTEQENCKAEGSLFMNENMTIELAANSTTFTINANGQDFDVFCGNATWANIIKEINVYGLNGNRNNYDYHKHVPVDIKLCSLQQESISFSY